MLDRTQKRVGHGREIEMGNGRRGIRRGKWGWYLPTLTACDRVSYYSGALRTGSMAFEATLWQNLDQLYAK